jgi:hypothetical protein
MEKVGSAGDAGFDAALKALEELENDAAPVSVAPFAPPSAIPPILAIDIGDPVAIAPMASAAIAADAFSIDDDLESMVNASLATVSFAASEPAPVPVSPPPPVPVAVSRPLAPAISGRSWLLAVGIAGLGVFASLLAVIGLIVTSRTVAQASLVVADARERQHELAKVGELVKNLELIRARQIELLQHQQRAVTTTPLSSEQFNKSIDNLRIDIGRHGPDAETLQVIRAGQVESNQRMTELTLKVMRIEADVAGGRRPSLPGGQ